MEKQKVHDSSRLPLPPRILSMRTLNLNVFSTPCEIDLYVKNYASLDTSILGYGTSVLIIEAGHEDYFGAIASEEFHVTSEPVGGIWIPVNKLELLAPYIGLTILLAVAVMTVGYIKKRKRN